VRRRSGRAVDVVVVGDFNRHDQVWGRDDVRYQWRAVWEIGGP
jgi:hypothetical protein